MLVVNPDDLEMLSESVQTLQAELGGIETCDVQADRRVGRGGVIVRTDAGEIDARIETASSGPARSSPSASTSEPMALEPTAPRGAPRSARRPARSTQTSRRGAAASAT